MLKQSANAEKASLLSRFFKTGPGQYGEGDVFLGVMVPEQRTIARECVDVSLDEVDELLQNKYHEVRLTALLILVYKVKRADEKTRREIFNFYLSHTGYINNWDLVDVTVKDIIGAYVFDFEKNRNVLYRLVRSRNMWERRIAIVATSYFIGKNDFGDTIALAEILLEDEHDLIHKATGWMLREVGKRDERALCAFLERHAQHMPRTMLRYALEKFPEKVRQRYMKMPRV